MSNEATASNNKVQVLRRKIDLSKGAIYSAAEWEQIDLHDDEVPLIGTAENKIIRLKTKNVIEAPEKSFKTTMAMRLAMGLAGGHPVYPELPVPGPAVVLYLHGELSLPELQERRKTASVGIPERFKPNYFEGKSPGMNFIEPSGQKLIMETATKFRERALETGLPYVIIFDPWQEFISGHDENSFSSQSRATRFLNTLIDKYGATLFLQMHQGKDPYKGARGHSCIAGWKDTTLRLKRKSNELTVNVEPRWAARFEFKLEFKDGTMASTRTHESPQTTKIRAFVAGEKRLVSQEQIERFLGGTADAAKKAIQRAINEKAIVRTSKGLLGLPINDEDGL